MGWDFVWRTCYARRIYKASVLGSHVLCRYSQFESNTYSISRSVCIGCLRTAETFPCSRQQPQKLPHPAYVTRTITLLSAQHLLCPLLYRPEGYSRYYCNLFETTLAHLPDLHRTILDAADALASLYAFSPFVPICHGLHDSRADLTQRNVTPCIHDLVYIAHQRFRL
jgi:hypothetical protein